MFTCKRELDSISCTREVTPNTTDSGKQFSFTLFLLSDFQQNNSQIKSVRQNSVAREGIHINRKYAPSTNLKPRRGFIL